MTGRKDDKGKPMLELLPPRALLEVGRVLAYGAGKYAPGNWRTVEPPTRYVGAALRHVVYHLSGEVVDPESGLSHLGHAAVSLLFVLERHLGGGA